MPGTILGVDGDRSLCETIAKALTGRALELAGDREKPYLFPARRELRLSTERKQGGGAR